MRGLDDPVIDVAVTPNRQDAMGVHGIARDLAAAGLGTLKPVEVAGDRRALIPARSRSAPTIREGCPAFYGRVDPRRAATARRPTGCSSG